MSFKEFRENKGYGDVDLLASNLGISTSYIYMMDIKERTPSHKLMRKMAALFGVTLDEISAVFFGNQHYNMLPKINKQAI